MMILVRLLLGLVFGWFAFRHGVHRRVFSIIPRRSHMPRLAFFRNDMGFGGNNGFTDFKDILGWTCTGPNASRPGRAHCGALAGSYWPPCERRIAGRTRDACDTGLRKSRTRFLGYSVDLQLWTLCFSAIVAGIPARPLCAADRYHQPKRVWPINSIEIVHLGCRRRAGHALRRGARLQAQCW